MHVFLHHKCGSNWLLDGELKQLFKEHYSDLLRITNYESNSNW